MKFRWTLFVAVVTLAAMVTLSMNLIASTVKGSDRNGTIPTPLATVERDCAPWDGPAFSVWIPAEKLGGPSQSWVYLRIWQQPEDSKGLFKFPSDGQRQKGAVVFFLDLESPKKLNWQNQPRQQLKGTVRFLRVDSKENVLAELDFVSDKNVQLRGNFEAKWDQDYRPVCG